MILTSQPMGAEGPGISLDLGIGSSIDPLHLSEVSFFTLSIEPDGDFKIGATRVRSVSRGPGNLLLCCRSLALGGNHLLILSIFVSSGVNIWSQ